MHSPDLRRVGNVEEQQMPVRALRLSGNCRESVGFRTVEEQQMPVRALRHFLFVALDARVERGGTTNAREGIETTTSDSAADWAGVGGGTTNAREGIKTDP